MINRIISVVAANNNFGITNIEGTANIVGNHNIDMDNRNSIVTDFFAITFDIYIVLRLTLFHLLL
jgi:hypothetical protein